jgi:Ca-activated chloride channel family protein
LHSRSYISAFAVARSLDWFLAAVLFIALLSLSGARAETGEPRLVKPGDATAGTLLFPSTQDGLYVAAPMLATDVAIEVSGPIARTRVTQRFENVSDGWIEGIYVFPLPDEAAVDTLKMQIGDRFIEGKIEEKRKAKEIYEAAKREGKKASLLEQERPNIFTNSVANIGPGETVVVQIEYQETVKYEDGKFSLRFPMVVAPRFNPPALMHNVSFEGEAGGNESGWGAVDPVPDHARIEPPVLHPDAGAINPVSLSVDLEAGFPIGEVTSSYHKVAVHRRDEAHATLALAEETTPADRDFELIWSPKPGAAPEVALFAEEIGGAPYYLLMITPPAADGADAAPAPREVTFVIDISGSMAGESIVQARESLLMALRRLKPGDAFNVIAFNNQFFKLFANPQPVDSATVGRALGYVASLDANGGTMMLPALEAALTQQSPDESLLRQVVFITDGAIGNEQQLFESIARLRGDARIFTVGIGSAPNSFFMSRAAEIGQGAFTHIGAVAEVAERMGLLFAKLEEPAVTNIRAEWPDGVAEIWPSPIPDLYKGETLVIAAKGTGEAGVLKISAETGGAPWEIDIPLHAAAQRNGVSKLWARKKIAALELDRVRPGAENDALEKQILDTALAHHLISRLTSLVAVDVTPSRPEGEALASAEMPVNLPKGWEFDKVVGDAVAPVQRESFAPGLLKTREAALDDASGAVRQAGPGAALPQGATLADAKMIRGLTLILMALLLLAYVRSGRRVFAMARR